MAPSQWPPGDPGLGEFPRGPGPLPPGPVDLGLPPGSATQCVFLIPLCLWAGLALAGRSAFHNRLISLHTGPDGRVLPGAGGESQGARCTAGPQASSVTLTARAPAPGNRCCAHFLPAQLGPRASHSFPEGTWLPSAPSSSEESQESQQPEQEPPVPPDDRGRVESPLAQPHALCMEPQPPQLPGTGEGPPCG